MQFVFGYGSLVADHPDATLCHLRGYARAWNVAMRNRDAVPGYKTYVDAQGERPDVYVTFLNIVPADASMLGAVFPVADFPDRRERNYSRVRVSHLLDADFAGEVWAYVGSAAGRARFEAGAAAGTAVIQRAYHDNVITAYTQIDARAHFLATTRPHNLPLRDLTRVNL